jgi:hypothetical protein
MDGLLSRVLAVVRPRRTDTAANRSASRCRIDPPEIQGPDFARAAVARTALGSRTRKTVALPRFRLLIIAPILYLGGV